MDYFPSRFDPARHAEQVPIPNPVLSGKREKVNFIHILVLIMDTIISNILFWYSFLLVHNCEREQLQAARRKVQVLGI